MFVCFLFSNWLVNLSSNQKKPASTPLRNRVSRQNQTELHCIIFFFFLYSNECPPDITIRSNILPVSTAERSTKSSFRRIRPETCEYIDLVVKSELLVLLYVHEERKQQRDENSRPSPLLLSTVYPVRVLYRRLCYQYVRVIMYLYVINITLGVMQNYYINCCCCCP